MAASAAQWTNKFQHARAGSDGGLLFIARTAIPRVEKKSGARTDDDQKKIVAADRADPGLSRRSPCSAKLYRRTD